MGSDPFITAVEGKNHRFWLRLPSVGGLTPLNQHSARASGVEVSGLLRHHTRAGIQIARLDSRLRGNDGKLSLLMSKSTTRILRT
jgi:hypothetical protein